MPAMSGRVAVTGRLNELVERHATASSRRFLQESRHGPTLTPATETTTANPAGPMNVPPGGRVRQASSRNRRAATQLYQAQRTSKTPDLALELMEMVDTPGLQPRRRSRDRAGADPKGEEAPGDLAPR